MGPGKGLQASTHNSPEVVPSKLALQARSSEEIGPEGLPQQEREGSCERSLALLALQFLLVKL